MEQEKKFYGMLRKEENDFSSYTMAEEMACHVNVEPVKPRSIGKMTMRPNTPARSIQEYYYRNSELTYAGSPHSRIKLTV